MTCHEENTCPSGARSPGDPEPVPLSGTCNTADCDCIEFLHQAILVAIGQEPGWFSSYMPTTQSEMLAMLSSDFKTNILNNAEYGLPTAPFNGDYTATLV